MKKITALIMVLSVIFLVGCSMPDLVNSETGGLVEMNIEQNYISNVFSIDAKGDEIMILSNLWVDENNEPVIPEDEKDSENYTDVNCLILYNAKKQKLILKSIIKDCPLNDIWGCEFGDDSIILYNEEQWKNAVYDRDMNFIELTDREKYDPRGNAEVSPFYTSGGSAANRGHVTYDGSTNNQYVYFTDAPETLYVRELDKYGFACEFYEEGKLIMNEFSVNNGRELDFSIEDYGNAIQINSVIINAGDLDYDFVSADRYKLGDTYACVIVYYYNENDPDNNHSIKAYSWNYCYEAENKEIPVSAFSYDELVSECEKNIRDIKDEYGVDIHINENHGNIKSSVNCDGETEYLVLFDDLAVIREFFESLPEGMIKEVYSDYDNGVDFASGIRLDIVSEITYDASAFAQRLSDPMIMCFSFSTVNKLNLAHEFMHLLDARIGDYIMNNDDYDCGLYDEWNKLNKGAVKNDDDSYIYDETQFISEYAATNDEEDRAEIFSMLYANADYSVPQLENDGVRKKAEVLCRLIREAFPSCENADTLVWEKQLQ